MQRRTISLLVVGLVAALAQTWNPARALDGKRRASLGATQPTSLGLLPDLVPLALDTALVVGDWQTLQITGAVGVTLENAGDAASGPFALVLFEDGDGNGEFTPGDMLLGSSARPGLAAGSSELVTVSVAGSVSFRDNLVHASVDALQAVPESDESNNRVHSGLDCLVIPPVGAIDPILEWSWTSSPDQPTALNVMMSPSVIDLTGDGIPEVVFGATASVGGGLAESGYLRALRGDDGSELFTVASPTISTTFTLATGDIDGDGLPEIVAGSSTNNTLIAFEHDGTVKWTSQPLAPNNWGAAALADLDLDGSPEIIVGRQVLNANGNLVWVGTGGSASQGAVGAIACVADVDRDGSPDIVAGNTVYDAAGNIQSAAVLPDGHNALANFDADPQAEIVLVAGGQVWLLGHDLTLIWGPVPIPGGGSGGPPTIANYDADPEPEIGVAGAVRYAVFETDGTLKWSAVTQDASSNRTGSSVFDFDGDGAAEVVYRDELFLRIYRGTDGATLFSTPMSSCTWHEYVLVADVDADGNAEIVAVANNSCGFGPQRGVFVFGSASDSWVATRRIWNEHAYHITNVADDGTVPPNEAASWLVPAGSPFNSYRQNVLSGLDSLSAPDLSASHVQATPTTLTARIGNGGALLVGAGIPVAFYDGDPSAGGLLLGTTATSALLLPGEFEDVNLFVGSLPATAFVSADDLGGLVGIENECDETNNVHGRSFQPPIFATPSPCDSTLTVTEGAPLSYTVGAEDPDGDVLTLDATGVPPGASHTPSLPATGSSVSTQFAWTPTAADLGLHVIVYTLSDGVDTLTCTVTIEVRSQPCVTLDFQSEDDFATPLVDGQSISTPPEFGTLVAISAAGANAGAAIFDSTAGGPNDPSQDTDLLVGRGNILILQNSQAPPQIGGLFPNPNDDQDGGDLLFDFVGPVTATSVVLIDIDVGVAQSSNVVLTDSSGRTRTYSVPPMWTEDILLNGGSGWRVLDLTTLAPQPGFASSATAAEQAGFDASRVVQLKVHLGSSGAVDDLVFCF